MIPKAKYFAMIACLVTAACSHETASDTLDTVGNETSASYNKMREEAGLSHETKKVVVKEAQPRYCYHTYQDVICYSRPLPGEEYRLVGFQTPQGKTGYTMPQTVVPGGADDTDLPPLKSVTVGNPPAVKGDNDKQLKEVIFDPSELEPKELVPDKPQ